MTRRLSLAAVLLAATIAAPASAQIPTPADIIGFAPGEDYKLARYDDITRYYQALAASSDRMVLEQIGESTRGEPLSTIPGVVPPLTELPSGCRFRDRCSLVEPACAETDPRLQAVGGDEHRAACIVTAGRT